MNNIKGGHHLRGGSNRGDAENDSRPYWKRAHYDWRFWVAVILMIVAMSIYVMSDDFGFWSRSRPERPISGTLHSGEYNAALEWT
jgi:hypothetical protein